MRYEILGPARVVDEHGASFVGARKVETLLVTLLIRADHVVGADQLVTEMWGVRAPRRAIGGLHVYVSQLRKLLGRSGRRPDPIITQPRGYLLRLGDDELDLTAFVRRVESGRAHGRAHRHRDAAEQLDGALALWRGPVLDDAPLGPVIGGFVTWLTETRLECLELSLESHLALGHHREIVGQLRSLTVAHPLREAFYRLLMLALHRSQRRADAVRVYQSAAHRLDRELGQAPGQALQELYHTIVDGGDLVGASRSPT